MNVIVFSFLERMSFSPLKILSSDAKLFGRRRLQFHILHAENFCSKLPKCLVNVTLFNSPVVEAKTSLYIPTYLKKFLLRFINGLAASLTYRTLSYLCFFLLLERKREDKFLAGVDVCRGENARMLTTGF